MMSTKLKQAVTLITVASALNGCLTLPKTEYSIVPVSVMTKEVKVDARVGEGRVLEAIATSLNEPTIVVGPYTEKLIKQYETNGEVVGVISLYDKKGVQVEQSSYDPFRFNYTFYNGEWQHDSRNRRWPALYSNYFFGSKNTLPMKVSVKRSGDNNIYIITTREKGYSVEKTEQRSPLSKDELVLDVQQRFESLSFNIPWTYEYHEELTLKNDDVTAFANIQRRFKDSFVSTNNKTDSEKFGSFVLSNGQKVNFSLYPYKNVAKLEYNFTYEYSFDEKGGSTFDKNYPGQIKKMVAREFNR